MSDWKITEWNAGKVLTKASDVNARAMEKAAYMVEKDVKESLSKPGTGKTAVRYAGRTGKGRVSKRTVRVSLPGMPPALDLGHLRASIDHKVVKRMLYVDGFILSAGVKYAVPLELGSHKMAPRPFLRPAVRRNRRKINKIFRDANK